MQFSVSKWQPGCKVIDTVTAQDIKSLAHFFPKYASLHVPQLAAVRGCEAFAAAIKKRAP